MTTTQPIIRAMISSTTLDLPEHRQEVRDACLRQDFFPVMMEHLPSDPTDGLEKSLQLVERSDIYILIIGARYGCIPPGMETSITEAEYNNAINKEIPIFVFIASDNHPFARGDVETGRGAEKLRLFQQKLEEKHTVTYFCSAEELGKLTVDSISKHRLTKTQRFHAVVDTPSPPTPYVAHPYVLLDSEEVIGRQNELGFLTAWANGAAPSLSSIRVLSVVAIGGMGKSALTWKWFSDIAPHEMNPLTGSLWWSFYESDASFENFVTRSLAYVRNISRNEALIIPAAEREEQLLDILDKQPFLLCLDGLERIMIAYAKPDAASMSEENLDEEAENFIRALPTVPEYSVESLGNRKRLRRTTDPRAGAFLRKLSRIQASRILISTRLYPAELQGTTGLELPGCKALFLDGLTNQDAITLWNALGVTGNTNSLLKLFNSFGNYPLLVRILAGEIAHFRPSPGNLDKWNEAHPDFDPFSLPLIQRKNHVLKSALLSLPPEPRQVLITLAAFRMPVSYDSLAELHTGEGNTLPRPSQLHSALSELEERGLIGWNRNANRYDLHPVVRGVVWHGLNDVGRELVHEKVHAHLCSLSKITAPSISSMDDLSPAIELYFTLIALGRHNEAYIHYKENLDDILLLRMNRFLLASQLLEALLPSPSATHSTLSAKDNLYAMANLSYCYSYIGLPQKAESITSKHIHSAIPSRIEKAVLLNNHAANLIELGRLKEAEEILTICEDIHEHILYRAQLGHIASLRGDTDTANELLQYESIIRSTPSLPKEPSDLAPLGLLFDHKLRIGAVDAASALAQRAINIAANTDMAQIQIDALEMAGLSMSAKELLDDAIDHLSAALSLARKIGSASEIGLTIDIAQIHFKANRTEKARELLADLWDPLQRGPLPLHHARACNLLAKIEHSASNTNSALDAARTAYQLAWNGGPPYSFSEELDHAKAIIEHCGNDSSPNLTLIPS